jgi:hypothetical protein
LRCDLVLRNCSSPDKPSLPDESTESAHPANPEGET